MCRPPAAPDETSGREQSNLRTLHGTFDSRRVDISLDPRRVASPASASRLMTYRFPFQTKVFTPVRSSLGSDIHVAKCTAKCNI